MPATEDSTRRRFERDKKTLQDSGVFLTIDDRQRYTLDVDRTVAAPLNLTGPQVSLLRLLCGALLEDGGYPFKEELRMVLVKLGDELEIPDMLPHLVESRGRGSSGTYEPQGFAKVKKATTTRKRLSFDYVNSAGKKSQREVEPMGMLLSEGHLLCRRIRPGRARRASLSPRPHEQAARQRTQSQVTRFRGASLRCVRLLRPPFPVW